MLGKEFICIIQLFMVKLQIDFMHIITEEKLKFCSLYSGSEGNCQFIRENNTKILIDAGLSGKKIQDAIKYIDESPENIKGILVTHEHADHIQGVGVLSRRYNIPIYANEKTWQAMEAQLGKIASENIMVFDSPFEIDDLHIEPFNISHDSVAPVGFKVFNNSKKITVLTDTGCVTEEIKSNLLNSDLILIEANHDEDMVMIGSYTWPLKQRILSDVGHMSNTLSGNVLTEILSKGTEAVLLGHLSKENNFIELAYKTVENILLENKIPLNNGISLDMTYRDKPSKVFNV